jgi:hypothetical protein
MTCVSRPTLSRAGDWGVETGPKPARNCDMTKLSPNPARMTSDQFRRLENEGWLRNGKFSRSEMSAWNKFEHLRNGRAEQIAELATRLGIEFAKES